MSQLEIRALETHFEGFKQDRYPTLPTSEAFERFAIVQILKDEDLNDDELESGILGGGDDGGIDGMYFFVNRNLVQDEADLPSDAISARLVIVQAKYETGFGENAVVKMEAFARDLLDYSRNVDGMSYLNADVRDTIRKIWLVRSTGAVMANLLDAQYGKSGLFSQGDNSQKQGEAA